MQLADLIQVDPSEIVRSLFMKGLVLSMSQVRGVGCLIVLAIQHIYRL
jgi:hypothetical protein